MFCHVAPEQVVGVHDVSSVYHVPLLLQSQGIVEYLQKRLNLPSINITPEMKERGLSLEARWRELTSRYIFRAWSFSRPADPPPNRQERLFDSVTIALVGKYTDMQDSYMSVVKSLEHSAFRCNRRLILKVPISSTCRSMYSIDRILAPCSG